MQEFSTNGMQIVSRIDSILHNKGQTRVQLAPVIGITPATISAWSTRGTVPAADIALKIADYLGVSMEWLITGKDRPIPSQEILNMAKRIFALPPEYRELVERQVEGFEGLCLRSQGEEKESGSA